MTCSNDFINISNSGVIYGKKTESTDINIKRRSSFSRKKDRASNLLWPLIKRMSAKEKKGKREEGHLLKRKREYKLCKRKKQRNSNQGSRTSSKFFESDSTLFKPSTLPRSVSIRSNIPSTIIERDGSGRVLNYALRRRDSVRGCCPL